jgi:hypothetical protein
LVHGDIPVLRSLSSVDFQNTILPPDAARGKSDDLRGTQAGTAHDSRAVAAARSDEAAVKAVMK